MNNNSPKPIFWEGDSVYSKIFLAYCRHFPQHRGKRKVTDLMARLFFKSGLPVRSNIGSRLKIDAVDWIGREIAYKGGYESKSLALAAKILSRGGVFIDAGCNFGLFSVSVGGLPGVRCVAIDASPKAHFDLMKNVRLNEKISVEPVIAALGSEPGLFGLTTPIAGNSGTTRLFDGGEPTGEIGFWASGSTLDTIMGALAISKVRLLKIDVEGFEMNVLQGLDFNGCCRPENILMECDIHGFSTARKTFDHLLSQGYEPFSVDGESISEEAAFPEFNVWFRDRAVQD